MAPAFSRDGILGRATRALLDKEFRGRSLSILKAFPLEYEDEVTDANAAMFELRRRAMNRHYAKMLGVKPLTKSDDQIGWMYEIPAHFSAHIEPSSVDEADAG
ncbi:hypothetical protein [Sphingobium boeckii]|uniref:Uncharacterized protein n=1 Tax=Sphingobium boeckii TaxID=1082345 RepID=A0A7W9AL98_9SPHN|nr:hypothetical protein [Sphingobium boeckii]MBB5687764.1 hypothetical protein [Sphingobium boeckii]